MTTKQFERLQESFALYANKETSYKSSTPYSGGKKVEKKACLMGIGVNSNLGKVILASCDSSYAILFEDVKLPKLAWEL